MIYFVQSVDGGPVKIGFTEDMGRRLPELEAHYGEKLAVLATIPGDRDRETEIHDRFSAFRIGRTEQFRPVVDIFAFIGKPLLVSPNPKTVEAMTAKTAGIRLDPEALQFARIAAAYKKMKLIDYLSMVIMEAAARHVDEGIARWKQGRPKG